MVPENFKDVIEGMISYAIDQDSDLEFMHQQSPSAIVAAAALRVQEAGSAPITAVLADLATIDPSRRWQQREALNALRTLGLRPRRATESGTEVNTHVLRVDEHFWAALKRHDLKLSVQGIMDNAATVEGAPI